ncbi:RHS repeat-associated core domain-containing protein [Streptomyces galbus]|uniref:RHS repeat-associated core domain-containing protein n=1 Tax=Streptomyces galbus TaxID=33898 RepID=UPI0035E3CAE3
MRILAQSSEPVAQPYRFAGNYQDPTGLYHLKARYYDANIGRFTQPDPSGQEQNPYLYAEGDPVNRIDPTGLASCLLGLAVCHFKPMLHDAVQGGAAGGGGGAAVGCFAGAVVGVAGGYAGAGAGCLTGGTTMGGHGLIVGTLAGGAYGAVTGDEFTLW